MDSLFRPVSPHFSQKLLLVLLYSLDKRLIFRIFVRGRPQHHFREDRPKIDSFGGEGVDRLSPIGGVSFGGYDSMSDQLPQAIRQYIRRNSLVRLQELLVAPESPQHHVADYQQRPAVAQNLHRRIQGTPRPPLRSGLLFWHVFTLTDFHLHLASKLGRLISVIQGLFFREDSSTCIISGSYSCAALPAGGDKHDFSSRSEICATLAGAHQRARDYRGAHAGARHWRERREIQPG